MKLCCFVILVFISVTFTVIEVELGMEVKRLVNPPPIPPSISSTNQNGVESKSQLLHIVKRLDKNLQEDHQEIKHPPFRISGPISPQIQPPPPSQPPPSQPSPSQPPPQSQPPPPQ